MSKIKSHDDLTATNQSTLSDFPKTDLDFKYLWKCAQCPFESFYMYLADSHQAETDHMFHERIPIDKLIGGKQ